MNYNFKTNWDDVILPLLSHPLIKKSIKKGITNFINIIMKMVSDLNGFHFTLKYTDLTRSAQMKSTIKAIDLFVLNATNLKHAIEAFVKDVKNKPKLR